MHTLVCFAAVSIAVAAPAQEPAAPSGHNGVTPPVLVQSAEAHYPRTGFLHTAKNSRVVVKLVVDKQGMPQNVAIAQSGGDAFDKAAMEAVEHYQFRPAMKDGQPVMVEMKVEVNFQVR